MTAPSGRACPCCDGRQAVSWRHLCNGCLWYAQALSACPHTLERELVELLREQGRLPRRAA